MSYMKNKLLEVMEMLNDGYSVDDVVSFTGIPYPDVLSIAGWYGVDIKDEEMDIEELARELSEVTGDW